MNLNEVGKTISAATAATLKAALNAIQELLDMTEAEAPETEGDNLAEAATKSEDGKSFPASDYAYVPDAALSSTWKLRLTATPGGEPDSGIVGAACAALGPGFRGQKVEIPEADLPAVKAKVRAAWRKANPDKDVADMPAGIQESEDADLVGDFVALVEATAVGSDGKAQIKVISPGWGTSGYYSTAVLARDGPKVFTAGMHMHLDHPTAQEEAQRPERSVKDLAGTLATDAVWNADGPAGPGLYAEANVFEPYRNVVSELAPHIGVSIRASGKAVRGEAEGRKGNIIEAITAGRSIDYVTVPGAGGQILQLFEAARGRQITQEVKDVNEEEARALTEANATLETDNARLREALLLREARDVVIEALAGIDMPVPTRARLTETLAKAPAIKDGVLDIEAFQTTIAEAAKAELLYLAEATGKGQIRGMGASSGPAGDSGNATLRESFKGMYLRQGNTPEEADKLAALAAVGR